MTIAAKVLGLEDARVARAATRILVPALVIVAVSVTLATTTRDASLARIFDNVYWTVAYLAAAALAWLGARFAPAPDARAKRWFALALTSYAVGQILWDIQVAIGWNPFPGPSDAFFIWLGPLTGVGCMMLLLRREGRTEHRAVLLDSGGLSIAVLALTLAMYLPKRGQTELWPLSFLVAYPVVLCWAASTALILVLALRLELRRGSLLFLSGLLLNAVLWLEWNRATLDGALADGTVLNALFPVGALAQGTGVLLFDTTPTTSSKWERVCEGTLRLLPLFIVVLCAAAVVLAFTLPHVPEPVHWSALGGGLAVVVIATLRQSLMLGERDRLIEAERELRSAEESFRVLVEQASDGIFIADVDGVYREVNPRGAEMLGMQRHEVIGLHIGTIVAPEDVARIAPDIERLRRGETVQGTWTFRRKDGSTFQGEVTGKQLSDGRLQGFVRDVSDRLVLEAQLRQSQKMEAMGVLAAGIAHDFNNLLTAIRGNAALAAEDVGPNHPAAASLENLEDAAARATELVHHILAFSRPRPPSRTRVALTPLVEEVSRLLRSSLPASIELVPCLPSVSPVAEADPAQIHQVLMNLCTNAWQAIGTSSGRIEIGVAARNVYGDDPGLDLPPGEYACLWVRDSGQGMPAAVQERIFEPFFTTKAPGEGTGLGLAVVHGIVRGHRGALDVKSSPNKGSTFTLYLPAAGSGESAGVADRDSGSRTRSRPLRVAYVDDEEHVASVMERLLERRGFVVRSFGSAAELLANLDTRHGAYDVIVTDFNMPRMTGIELARAIRSQGLEVGLVLTSGYVSDQLRVAAAEVGITHLVKKPESLDLLCAVIRDVAPAQPPATAFESTAM